jgi:hypothetical protein
VKVQGRELPDLSKLIKNDLMEGPLFTFRSDSPLEARYLQLSTMVVTSVFNIGEYFKEGPFDDFTKPSTFFTPANLLKTGSIGIRHIPDELFKIYIGRTREDEQPITVAFHVNEQEEVTNGDIERLAIAADTALALVDEWRSDVLPRLYGPGPAVTATARS